MLLLRKKKSNKKKFGDMVTFCIRMTPYTQTSQILSEYYAYSQIQQDTKGEEGFSKP